MIEFEDGSLTKEECAPLLLKEAMSDEEDDEVIRDHVAKNFKVMRPSWRSAKVSVNFIVF